VICKPCVGSGMCVSFSGGEEVLEALFSLLLDLGEI